VSDRSLLRSPAGRPRAGRRYALLTWYGLMAFVGLGFGSLADRRPFGEDILVHPLVLFFILVGLGLIALRVLLARPVPEVLSDRALIAGCVLGLAMFLVGNFASAHLQPFG
jgi:hypothetical protein